MTWIAEKGHPWRTYRKEFVLLASLLLLTRVADGLLTIAITPDLDREMNPLTQWLGFRWGGLIATAAAVIVVTLYLNYRSLSHPVDNFPTEPGLPLAEFQRHYFDPRQNEVLVKSAGRLVVYVFGYVMPHDNCLEHVGGHSQCVGFHRCRVLPSSPRDQTFFVVVSGAPASRDSVHPSAAEK